MGRTLKVLTVADVVAVNRSMVTTFGGFFVEGDRNLGNPGSLEYALEAIQGSLFGQDLHPTLVEKAALLCWSIIRNHVFHDANKRTGMEVCRLFLDLNGYTMRIDEEVVAVAVDIADKNMTFEEFVDWVANRTVPKDSGEKSNESPHLSRHSTA